MTSSNSIKKELLNYNKELEKYLTKVPFDMSQDFSFDKLSDTQATNLEVLSFIQDIRDEMSLLRKHLYSDVQSLVTKTLRAEQEKHLTQMRHDFNSMIKEMADSKNYLLSKIRDETAQVHHDLKDVDIDVGTINSKIDTLVQAVYDANQNQISLQNQVSTRLKEIETELLVNQHAIEGFNNSLKKDYVHSPGDFPMNQHNQQLNVASKQIKSISSKVGNESENCEQKLVEHRIARIDAALHKLNEIQ